MFKLITALAFTAMVTVPAAARTGHSGHYLYYHRRSENIQHRHYASRDREAHYAASRPWLDSHSFAGNGRPRQWCGWQLRQELGVADRSYNLARNWVHYGIASSGPQDGAIVVWPHHVGRIVGQCDGGWIVHSGNDGGTVRDSCRSVRGAIAFRLGGGFSVANYQQPREPHRLSLRREYANRRTATLAATPYQDEFPRYGADGALITTAPPAVRRRFSGGNRRVSSYSSSGQAGIASVDRGGRTASGQYASARGLTAASRSLPFGTMARVTNVRNGRSVAVRIAARWCAAALSI